MRVYESEETYRIVAADGGVRVLMPGGFATTAVEEYYPNTSEAAEAIQQAIKDGMPTFEVADETASLSGG